MNKINGNNNKFQWLYKVGFFIILALPILVIPPWFFPPDWGKTIIFRSIISILAVLYLYQLLFKKNEVKIPEIRKNTVFWCLVAFFVISLVASILSVDPLFSFWGSPYRGGGFVNLAFCIIFALSTFMFLRSPDWKKAWDFSIIIGILVSLVALIQYYGLFNRIFMSIPDRPYSTLGSPMLLATYLLILFFVSLSYGIKEPFDNSRAKIKKIFYFASLALFTYVILITGSRAVYLGLAIGLLYLFMFYPQKIKLLKMAVISLSVLIIGFIIYVNTINQYPKLLQDNKLFTSVADRLSIRLALADPRFHSWSEIDYKILIEKPILGYGPENFAVGFDKYYDPSVPYLSKAWGSWYDRAHNIILQTGSDAGFLGIITYLALFITLFWQLQKLKNNQRKLAIISVNPIIAHGIQAALIGYFISNLFSFDTFSTYLIFFLLIGYSLHIISSNTAESENPHKSAIISVNPWIKSIIISILFCVLIVFTYQYNFVPLQINAQINKATILADKKQCDKAVSLMDKALLKHSFLDSYIRMKYIEIERTCAVFYPENNLSYTKRGVEILNEAIKIQPLYTRYWLYLGTLTTTLAEQEEDTVKKNILFEQANNYLDKALQLSPKHQEILVAKTKLEIDKKNYINAKNYSDKCISLSADLSDCYWYLGLAEIYLKNNNVAENNIKIANEKGYAVDSEVSLVELANSYNYNNDYKNLATIFKKLTIINPNAVQYHSSLAAVYAELGRYNEARQEAMKVLQLSPASKQNVDAFLRTLP